MTRTALDARDIESRFVEAEVVAAGSVGSVRRRLLPDFPLDVFVEVRLPEREWALVVDSRESLDDRELVLTAGVVCRSRGGTVEVTAQCGPGRPGGTDTELFCTLLADLLQYLPRSPTGPATALVRRIRSWQRMLERGLSTGLPRERQQGLFGELLVLRELLLPARGSDAVTAWVGPTGTPWDFLCGTVALEAKTTSHRDPGRCRVSSERQLDDTALDRLFLVHQVLRVGSEGVSLPELVEELRASPEVAPQQGLLEERLIDAGWLDVHARQYEETRYTLSARRCFAVGPGFPRIVPADLPPGVRDVSYRVELTRCGDHTVTEKEVRALLTPSPEDPAARRHR